MVYSVVVFGFCGFCYLILALQIRAGFPAFYTPWRWRPDVGHIKDMLPAIAVCGGIVSVVVVTGQPVVFGALGVAGFWYGWRIRTDIRNQFNGPMNWVIGPKTAQLLLGRPMLPFDVWTIGLVAIVLAILL